MRNRGVKKQFWFSRDEDYLLKLKSSKAGLNESDSFIPKRLFVVQMK